MQFLPLITWLFWKEKNPNTKQWWQKYCKTISEKDSHSKYHHPKHKKYLLQGEETEETGRKEEGD